MTININELVAEFGSHYVDGGQGMQNLQELIRQRSVTAETFPLLPTDDTIVYKATTSIGRVLQAFQKAFTPIVANNLKFELNKIPLYHIKIDESIWPDDIMPSWAGFLASNNLKRDTWPLCRYIIEKHIWPQQQADLELNEIFKGVATAPVAGTAGDAGKSLNGIRTQIRTAHTADQTNLITMGAAPTDNALDFLNYCEDFIGQVPSLIRKELSTFPLSTSNELLFRMGMDLKYNQNYAQNPAVTTFKYFPNIKVVSLPSHEGSDMLYVTPEFNKAAPKKAAANRGKFDVQLNGREVRLLSDWWEGIGFWYNPYIYHSDQDLV